MHKGLSTVAFYILFLLFSMPSNAWEWSNLWDNNDQRAQKFMQQKNYTQARDTFQRQDWKAVAAFRAKDHKNAAQWFSDLHTEEGYYNAGNALAFLGQLEKAIQAYDQALAINPKHQDALYNRKIIEKLLKQQEQKQQQQKQEKQEKQKKSGDNPSRHPERSEGAPKTKANASSGDPSSQAPRDDVRAPTQKQQKQSQSPHPKQENPSWLNYIPDDPGGLLREKFLRDYLKRHPGNN